ncbi:hypothetical protein O181_098505 [Austropuccinia psidii MF-1]|uniref:Uncharacterized protein n=1 Tax=Austropuccinia psidii MF-1 TaxID=1389203 RepID=A0A9Q3JBR0_9BASI|nr:hypothetical protein [Austropuccinia psidii MF-1]
MSCRVHRMQSPVTRSVRPCVTERTIKRHLHLQTFKREVLTSTLISSQKSSINFNPSSKVEISQDWFTLGLSLIVYLHVIANLSQNETNICLRSIKLMMQNLNTSDLPCRRKLIQKFPIDVQSSLSWLKIQPCIKKTLCCPNCFKLFDSTNIPTNRLCNYQETNQSNQCFSALFTNDGKPIRQYYTQSFKSWLKEFLMRDGIEELLLLSTKLKPNKYPEKNHSSLWQGHLWTSFKNQKTEVFTSGYGNLMFAMFVDWFNPLGNKASGKHKSVGVIILFCLSLPPSHRYRLNDLFLAGITPGPSEPTVLQMNNTIGPLVVELLDLWENGLFTPTPHVPKGRLIKAALVAVVCDLPAVCKLIGYASHSARNFCSFCYLKKNDNHCLNYQAWRMRHLEGHRKESNAWKEAHTKSQRKELFDSNGVQWSILNELSYWDPTQMTVVEPMHCMSGMLEWHSRKAWQLDLVAATIKNQKSIINTNNNQIEREDFSMKMIMKWKTWRKQSREEMRIWIS